MKKQLLLPSNNNITSKLLCPHDYHEQLALMHALSYALSTRRKAMQERPLEMLLYILHMVIP